MYTILLILAMMSSLSNSSSNNVIKINSNDFCKPIEKDCAQINAPHLYQCGPGIYARNQTECNKYLSAEKAIRHNHIRAMIDLTAMNRIRNYNEIMLQNNFKTFQNKIKNCFQQPNAKNSADNEACNREVKCFKKKFKFASLLFPKKTIM